MTTQQISKVLPAIKKMEKACLSSDSTPSTAAKLRENGLEETRKYFAWLKQQAPVTGMFFDFDNLVGAA